jgi:hypothetical protein
LGMADPLQGLEAVRPHEPTDAPSAPDRYFTKPRRSRVAAHPVRQPCARWRVLGSPEPLPGIPPPARASEWEGFGRRPTPAVRPEPAAALPGQGEPLPGLSRSARPRQPPLVASSAGTQGEGVREQGRRRHPGTPRGAKRP